MRKQLKQLRLESVPRTAQKNPDVMGQQTRNVISAHGGHDIGIVDLLAAERELRQQLAELSGHSGGIVRHLKPLFQIPYPLNHHLRR